MKRTFTVIGALTGAAVGAGVMVNMKDIRRYLRIRRM